MVKINLSLQVSGLCSALSLPIAVKACPLHLHSVLSLIQNILLPPKVCQSLCAVSLSLAPGCPLCLPASQLSLHPPPQTRPAAPLLAQEDLGKLIHLQLRRWLLQHVMLPLSPPQLVPWWLQCCLVHHPRPLRLDSPPER